MSQAAVKQFLYETLGYQKLAELMEGSKPYNIGTREFFKETIFGTFATVAVEVPVYERIGSPRPSKINTIIEAVDKPNEYGSICVKLESGDNANLKIEEFDLGLSYLIKNATFFRYQTPGEIHKFISEFKQRLFPNSDFRWYLNKKPEVGRGLCGIVVDNDFYFKVDGSVSRKNARIMKILFNIDPSIVGKLNALVSRYYAFLNSEQKETPPIDISTIQTYPKLIEITNNLQPSQLEESLLGCECAPFHMGIKYSLGNVISHQNFGLGLVISTTNEDMKVNFPSINQTKTLAHNRK